MSTTTEWKGESSTKYKYHVNKISWVPDKEQDGNYIFAKLVRGVWNAVYIGQGDLRKRYDAALREGCVTEKGATHCHMRLNGNANDRIDEERDLIVGNRECMWPNGCNGHD